MSVDAVSQTCLASAPLRRGKVRDVYDLGDRILLVATDRISAFDCVLPDPVPHKGRVLAMLSKFWFERLTPSCPHHFLSLVEDQVPAGFEPFAALLRRRAMLCRKAEVMPIECVARGYLAGSAWKEYQATGAVCGIPLPRGLRQSDQLPEPIFTPAVKAAAGHDQNVSLERAAELVGEDVITRLRDMTMTLYRQVASHARSRGIIVADTKFEFGFWHRRLILVDEVATPDSSRFWPADRYQPGRPQEGFDKQPVRDYLQLLYDHGRWNKAEPAPTLPTEIVDACSARYLEIYQRLTGQPLPLD